MEKKERMWIIIVLFVIIIFAIIILYYDQTNDQNDLSAASSAAFFNEIQESQYTKYNITDSSITESEAELLEETKFSYFHGIEYEEETMPKRFGYVVEEKLIDREVPLNEVDFKELRKGQYMTSRLAETFNSEYPGIIDIVGGYDGQMMATSRSPGTGLAKTKPYYKIDDNTYVVLYFEDLFTILPLERIEVWDAEGNKLREIEIN